MTFLFTFTENHDILSQYVTRRNKMTHYDFDATCTLFHCETALQAIAALKNHADPCARNENGMTALMNYCCQHPEKTELIAILSQQKYDRLPPQIQHAQDALLQAAKNCNPQIDAFLTTAHLSKKAKFVVKHYVPYRQAIANRGRGRGRADDNPLTSIYDY